MKKRPATTSLSEYKKQFSPDQLRNIKREVSYYDLLSDFKIAREKMGMSQADLAKKANVNRTTLSKVETGLRNATVDTLAKLSQALDLKLEIRAR